MTDSLILGLHFGHDAAASIIKNGEVIAYVMRERIARIKHALGLDKRTIDAVLQQANVSLPDISFIAISSTQRKELIFSEHELFKVSLEKHENHQGESSLSESFKPELNRDLNDYLLKPEFRKSQAYEIYSLFYPEVEQTPDAIANASGWMDRYIDSPLWSEEKGLEDIAGSDFSAFIETDEFRHGFHYPVTVELMGHAFAGYFIHHHMCHAACSYYTSSFDSAAILTHDGHSRPATYNVGMFYYGQGHKIYPLVPHHLFLGALYDHVGIKLNLGHIGPAGKLMGLSSWGNNCFSLDGFVGNWYDFMRQHNTEEYRELWFKHCIEQAKAQGYDLSPLGDKTQMTAPINVDIAYSTQKLFEQIYLKAVNSVYQGLENSGIFESNLCLSGGTALNCPSNSVVWQESAFTNLSIEPCCDDSGVAIGAALALYHNVLDNPRTSTKNGGGLNPYLGQNYDQVDLEQELQTFTGLTAEKLGVSAEEAAQFAAKELSENKVVGWYEGQSEVGPRALGHRSILANPKVAGNWQHVNGIKKRELWRPFAPVVLEEESEHYFTNVPIPSPYMLFNAQVDSDVIPAVTHVDGSARIQTAGQACGGYYQVLKTFKTLTGVSVLMNTSLNGPGEPIVETPFDALRFFNDSELDVLYINGWRVVKNDQ